MIAALLPALFPILGDALKRIFPDPEQAAKAQMDLQMAILAKSAELETAAASIVKAEAESEHWLTASWRPILMLTFGCLIVARWLGYSAPGLSEGEVLKLWSIVELGIGGYVIGRSAEKIVPQVASALAPARR
jgi:hypothetical protein